MQRRFFEITELVEHLFGYSERSTLAAFASTCRALSELALDYLWGEYGNFDALMALLPDDIELEIADIDFDDPASPSLGTQEFTRKLVTSDWELLNKYIHRLHTVEISTDNIGHESLNHLCNSCPSEFLFPNLRVLKISLHANEGSQISSDSAKIFSPKLQVLEVEDMLGEENPHALYFPDISLVPMHCRNLREIIWGPCHSLEIGGLSNVIYRCNTLERLRIAKKVLPARVTSHIMNLPHITELEWHCDDIEPCPPDSAPILPLLRSWTQESKTVDPVLSILSQLHQQTKLEDLHVHVAKLQTSNDVQEILDLMEHSLDPAKLQAFYLSYDACAPGFCHNLIHLTPLLTFRDLHILSINSHNNLSEMKVDVDNARLAMIASCWPNLRHLHLPTDPTRVDSNGLLALLYKCPHLRDLELQLTLSMAALYIGPLHDRKYRYPTLVSLNVGKSMVKDPTGVEADFLHQLFPHISSIRYSAVGRDSGEWKKMNLNLRSQLYNSLRVAA